MGGARQARSRRLGARGAPRWLALFVLTLGLTVGVEDRAAHAATLPTYHSFVGSRVILIGDSHTYLSAPSKVYRRYDVDARPGRRAAEAFSVLDRHLRGRHRKVVFDIGTNDWANPRRFCRNLRRVWRRISRRKLVLVTSWRIDSISEIAVNRVLKRFHRRHPRRSELVRWDARAKRRPRLFSSDEVHFTPQGYAKRARMVKRGTRRA